MIQKHYSRLCSYIDIAMSVVGGELKTIAFFSRVSDVWVYKNIHLLHTSNCSITDLLTKLQYGMHAEVTGYILTLHTYCLPHVQLVQDTSACPPTRHLAMMKSVL